MKKTLFPLILTVFVLATSCNTTKKLYEAKEYDQVIMRNAPKICAGHINAKQVALTAASYHEANQADHERIQALKASGAPDIWPEVFERYCSMKGRNDALSRFPQKIKRDINYTRLDLDDEIQGARNKAEAYLTAKIEQSLNNEADLDQADRLIRDLERVNRNNAHINDLKLKSLAKRYGDITNLMKINYSDIQVSPNRDETVTFKETKDNLTATVTDHKLSKSATIKGNVLFFDSQKKKRILFKYPFDITSKFEHSYSTVEGSKEACSQQTMERMKQQPMPFPTDESLLEDAERQLIELIYKKIQ